MLQRRRSRLCGHATLESDDNWIPRSPELTSYEQRHGNHISAGLSRLGNNKIGSLRESRSLVRTATYLAYVYPFQISVLQSPTVSRHTWRLQIHPSPALHRVAMLAARRRAYPDPFQITSHRATFFWASSIYFDIIRASELLCVLRGSHVQANKKPSRGSVFPIWLPSRERETDTYEDG